MRSEALSNALATRLRDVVPEGISVQADRAGVLFLVKGKPHAWQMVTAGEILDDPEDRRSDLEKVELAAYRVINGFQDFVAEELAAPWPGVGTTMPSPNAEVRHDQLWLWYGEADSPALDLPPVPLHELE